MFDDGSTNIRPDAYLSRIQALAIHAQPYWTIKGIFCSLEVFPSIIREFYCFSLQLFQKVALFSAGRRKLGAEKEETETEKFIELWIKSGNFLVSAAPENPKIDKIPVNVDIEIGVVQPTLENGSRDGGDFGNRTAFSNKLELCSNRNKSYLPSRQSPKYLKCN